MAQIKDSGVINETMKAGFHALIRQLEMKEKRQAATLEDTRLQLAALRAQLQS